MAKWTWNDIIAHMGTYGVPPSATASQESSIETDVRDPEEVVYEDLDELFSEIFAMIKEDFGGESNG